MKPDIEELRTAIRAGVFVQAKDGARIIAADEASPDTWIFDFRAILLQPKWLDLYAEIFWRDYADRYPFQVCAMESAGISLVAAIVMKGLARGTPVNGLFVRKSRKRTGLLKQIEGMPTKDPVILVDDLVNAGNTFNKQIKVLGDAGLRVTDIFATLAFRDRSAYEPFERAGIRLRTIFTLKDFGLPLLSPSPLLLPGDRFETLWHFKAPNPSYNFVVPKSAPIIDEERIYFGTDIGTFFALQQADGKVVWRFSARKETEGKGIFSSPALCDGLVYFGAYDGSVYALEAETGVRRWEYDDADWIGSSPAIATKLGYLFIGLEYGLFRKRGGIAALDLKTGKEIWKRILPALTHGSPLYIEREGLVVIGSNDAMVYAYDAKTGEPVWDFESSGDIKASLAYDPKRRLIIFGSLGPQIFALSARDGSPVWAKETEYGIFSTPCLYENTAYIASLDKHIYALDLDTGAECWKFRTGGRIFASPTIANGSLWCGSNDGRLYELDRVNGKLRSTFQAPERIVNKIAYNPHTHRFFVPTQANEMYCIAKTDRRDESASQHMGGAKNASA